MSAVQTVVHKAARANMRLGLYTPRIREFCFVLGAMKSGTTTLYRYLVQHPQIAPNQFQKEPEFFSTATAPQDLRPYLRQWLPRPYGRQIALEASTGYTKRPAFPDVAARLAALPGRKHLIYIMRNPIDRIESHLAHNFAAREQVMPAPGDWPALDHALAVSSYAMQLDAYRAALPDCPVKLLSFDQLRRDPAGMLAAVCAHLDLDPGFAFAPLAPQNTRATRADVQAFRLTQAQRDDIATRLRPDMIRLRDDYGCDIAQWGFS
ncbi:sulfotransferase [Loktanella sp. 3ANDIMAR09]|uniref:sulfotransferase family protein n=1 Tax=Loktanella sp. 3ANDIMAR09 TaxID=1225657 RepID=UPI0006F2304C|nr:sulfotransferase [Loktanella sp. 3ANDIMAR09]